MSLTTADPAPTDAPARDLASPVAAYDSDQREKARADGEPTDRTRGAGFPPSESAKAAFCWIDHTSQRVVHRVDDFDTGSPAPVNVDVLARLFDEDFVLVVPDSATVARLIRATASALGSQRCDPDRGNTLRRRLDIASRLSASSRLVVLTKALSRRYWMPSNLAADDALAWARAFGLPVGKGVTLRLMTQLAHRASDGADDPYATQAGRAERDALAAARYPGLKMAVAAYGAVERTESALSAWARLDERLLARNVLAGDVCRLDIVEVDDKGFTAVASQPFTMRVGKRHLLLTRASLRERAAGRTREGEGRLSHVELSEARVVGDQVVVEIATTSTPAEGRTGRNNVTAQARVRRAFEVREPLYLTEEPFTGGRPNAELATGRWSAAQPPEPVSGRWDIPLDVAFAGSPRVAD